MKAILSALALMLFISPAFADVTIELKSVEVNAMKSNGKTWDVKIPLMKKSELPDLMVEVKNGEDTILKTIVNKNALNDSFDGASCVDLKKKMKDRIKAKIKGKKPAGVACKVVVANAHAKDVSITVWDADKTGNDEMGKFSIVGKDGDVSFNGNGVKGLAVTISGNKAE